MGDWTDTCLLSGLPIDTGDPVTVYLVRDTPSCGQGFYPDDVCKIISHPIFGKYDGYGGLNDVINMDFHKILIDFCKENIDIGDSNGNDYNNDDELDITTLVKVSSQMFSEFKPLKKGKESPGVLSLVMIHAPFSNYLGLEYKNSPLYPGNEDHTQTLNDNFEEEWSKYCEFTRRGKESGFMDDKPYLHPLGMDWQGIWAGACQSYLSKEHTRMIWLLRSYLYQMNIELKPSVGKGGYTYRTDLHKRKAELCLKMMENMD